MAPAVVGYQTNEDDDGNQNRDNDSSASTVGLTEVEDADPT